MADYHAALQALLSSNDIDEIGLVIREDTSRVSDAFVLDDTHTKLGIAYWATPHVYKHALSQLFQTSPSTSTATARDDDDVMSLSSSVLLINPDCATAWNRRKKCRSVDGETELKFIDLVFSKHNKSGEGWAHRRWVLETLFLQRHIKFNINRELKICHRIAESYPKNYHAWTHRLWILQRHHHQTPAMIDTELLLLHLWTSMHVSDNSGFHYLGRVIEVLAKTAKQQGEEALQSLAAREFAHADDLMGRYEGHEAVWCHRRFLFHLFVVTLHAWAEAEKAERELAVVDGILSHPRHADYLYAAAYAAWILQFHPSSSSSSSSLKGKYLHVLADVAVPLHAKALLASNK